MAEMDVAEMGVSEVKRIALIGLGEVGLAVAEDLLEKTELDLQLWCCATASVHLGRRHRLRA